MKPLWFASPTLNVYEVAVSADATGMNFQNTPKPPLEPAPKVALNPVDATVYVTTALAAITASNSVLSTTVEGFGNGNVVDTLFDPIV